MALIKTLTTIDSVLSICRKLSMNLNTLRPIEGTDEERKKRSKFFSDSGIHKYLDSEYGSNFKVDEISEIKHIILPDIDFTIGKNTVMVTFSEGIDSDVKMKYWVKVEISERKWQKKYGHLKPGDSMRVKGAIEVLYSNGYRNIANLYGREGEEFYSCVFITVHM